MMYWLCIEVLFVQTADYVELLDDSCDEQLCKLDFKTF